MTFISGVPSWIVMVFGFMIVSQIIRAAFGGSRTRGRIARKWDLVGRQEVERLEAAIGQRDEVIEDLQQRLSELESRQDFAERMIAGRTGEQPVKEPAPFSG